MGKRTVVIGILGSRLDSGKGDTRWEQWRPTVDLCRHEDLLVDRLDLIVEKRSAKIGDVVAGDIATVSPETTVRQHRITWRDAWDFQEVYSKLHDFARSYPFDVEKEDYLIHITTGTHVAQICCFLLTESRHYPGRLLQTSPPPARHKGRPGRFAIIDLDLSRYDRLASRFLEEKQESLSFLKSGIETKNAAFNELIAQIERVAGASVDPILLLGPTGAGKSQLARRIFDLKHLKRQVTGSFVEVNCATIRGDGAMSALFGHVKGAYTGAVSNRPGLIRAAHEGILFLDEIGELGADEQAMLLRAVEEKSFLPVGTDKEATSDFQLIAGTNQDLKQRVRSGSFREDLLARINLWTFELPGLAQRPEDIAPNLDYELSRWLERTGRRVTINKEARARFVRFSNSNAALWSGNFRDFNAAITRMATLSASGRINEEDVASEISRLNKQWSSDEESATHVDLEQVLGPERYAELDEFDRIQLAGVLNRCRQSKTLSEAGRQLFSVSRKQKKITNDADRLRKYLVRFGLTWDDTQLHEKALP